MEPDNNQNQAEKTAKSKKSNLLVIIIVVALVSLSAIGYFAKNYFAKKTGEKVAENILSAATGNKVDINTDTGTTKVTSEDSSVEISNQGTWPETMPTTIPQYSDGDITVSSSNSDNSSGSSWSVGIQNTSKSAYDSYAAKLISQGWTNSATTTYNQSTTKSFEKGDYNLIITFVADNNNVSMAVTQK